MAVGGFAIPGASDHLRKKNIFNPSQAYPGAIQQQAGDYDEIMQGYRSIFTNPYTNPGGLDNLQSKYGAMASASPFTFNESAPDTVGYGNTGRTDRAIRGLETLSQTGGFSGDEISDIRARAISPIRSIYANAQQNLTRQKALSGGYAPGAAAATSRMARELSESIAGHTTNANAEIARMVQSGRLSAAPQFAQAAAGEQGRKTNIDMTNAASKGDFASRRLEAARLNRESQMTGLGGLERVFAMQQNQDAARMDALTGMRSLYGTTPALASTYGNQALQSEQIALANPKKKRRTLTGIVKG